LTASPDIASVLHHGMLGIPSLGVNPLQVFIKTVLLLVHGDVAEDGVVSLHCIHLITVVAVRRTAVVFDQWDFNIRPKGLGLPGHYLASHGNEISLLVPVLVNALHSVDRM